MGKPVIEHTIYFRVEKRYSKVLYKILKLYSRFQWEILSFSTLFICIQMIQLTCCLVHYHTHAGDTWSQAGILNLNSRAVPSRTLSLAFYVLVVCVCLYT